MAIVQRWVVLCSRDVRDRAVRKGNYDRVCVTSAVARLGRNFGPRFSLWDMHADGYVGHLLSSGHTLWFWNAQDIARQRDTLVTPRHLSPC